MNQKRLAADIMALANQVEAGGKSATLFHLMDEQFTGVFRQLEGAIRSVKRRPHFPDQSAHLARLEKVYDELESIWGDMDKTLETAP